MDIYDFVKNIGNGMFGQVYLTEHKIEKKHYAVKRINFQEINQKDRENIENEVKFLQDLKHPNIVSYKDSFCDRDNFFNIVMVYCDGGDFYNKIKTAKNKHYTENEILDWIVQLGLALLYIHDKKILHRDLKTQNIFLKDGKIRIGDFGIAKMFNHTRDLANSVSIRLLR
jgi:serine/threonine protein kinase